MTPIDKGPQGANAITPTDIDITAWQRPQVDRIVPIPPGQSVIMVDRREHDARPSIRHDRSTSETFDAFIFVPGTYEQPGKPIRLRVLAGEKAVVAVEITEEGTTSESRSAESLVDCVYGSISLTTEQAEWLHETLGRALAWEREREADESVAPQPAGKEW